MSYVPVNANGKLIGSGSNITIDATTAVTTMTSAQAVCSPLTEIYGSGGTTNDYVFASVTASGTETGCSGACLYNFLIGTAGAISVPGNSTAGIASAGGSAEL